MQIIFAIHIIVAILTALAAKALWWRMKASQNKFLQYAYGIVMLICSYISLGVFSPILGLMSAIGYPIIFKTNEGNFFRSTTKKCEKNSQSSLGIGTGREMRLDELPNGQGEFGLEITNPVPVDGIPAIQFYIRFLLTADGHRVHFKRGGSYATPQFGGPTDAYEISDQNGKFLARIYVNAYAGGTSEKAPKGFRYFRPFKDTKLADDVAKALKNANDAKRETESNINISPQGTMKVAQTVKSRIHWKQWLIVLGMGVVGGLAGWKISEQDYPPDSQADVKIVETTIGGILEAAHTDNMSRMVEREEYIAALNNPSQAMSKLLYYASNLNVPAVTPPDSSPAYPNYDMARDNFLISLNHLHNRDNRLKATLLYYDATGWYPNPPTYDHDWRKLNQTIPWNLNDGETAKRLGYAIGFGGALAVSAWLAIVLARWAWNFILARIRDVSQAVRGR